MSLARAPDVFYRKIGAVSEEVLDSFNVALRRGYSERSSAIVVHNVDLSEMRKTKQTIARLIECSGEEGSRAQGT